METKVILHTGNSVEDSKSKVIEEIKILLSIRMDMVSINFETIETKDKITSKVKITSIAIVYFEKNNV